MNPTINSAAVKYTVSTTGFNNSATRVFMPKRNSRHGRAKNNTKLFNPGTADSGNTPRCAAR